MSFFETPRFPDCISFGAIGGPTYFTEVVTVASGHEQRNEVWEFGRQVWDVSHGVRTDSDMHQLIAFFRSMRGRTHGFRFKDWSDFDSQSGGTGILGTTGFGSGVSVYQMLKRYTPGGSSFDLRKITKPINGTVTIIRAGVPITTGFSIDYTSGQVGFNADSSVAVSNITQANPAVVTTISPHGFSNGNLIFLANITGGMSVLNNFAWSISAASGSTFTLTGVSTVGLGAFAGFATASKYVQTSESLNWTGEFDVPCRFNTDEMKIGIVDKRGR